MTFITSAGNDKVLIVFGDNSLVILSLPTLSIIDLVECSWISKQAGDIVTVHVDVPSEKGFIYIGTTEGLLLVLECIENTGAIRVCDYSVNWSEAGLKSKMAISSLQICPKDEKYIAIGYDGADSDHGVIVIFDLVKKKSFRLYEVEAITSLSWVHTGEVLYAGTRKGNIIAAFLEKFNNISVWNSNSVEKKDDKDDDDIIIIRKVEWLPQQHGNSNTAGCLFVLLGAFGDSSANSLSSVLIALAPESGIPGETLSEIMCIPPLNEDVVGFRVVPSIDKSLIKIRCGGGITSDATNIIPTILMVTQYTDQNDNILRQLKILRCPTTIDVRSWALEIGTLSEPRGAIEVLAGGGSNVKCITALLPPIQGSIGSVLLNTATMGESVIEMLRKSSISMDENIHTNDNILLSNEDKNCTWEMVLSSATPDDVGLISKALDIVILGHEDG